MLEPTEVGHPIQHDKDEMSTPLTPSPPQVGRVPTSPVLCLSRGFGRRTEGAGRERFGVPVTSVSFTSARRLAVTCSYKDSGHSWRLRTTVQILWTMPQGRS